MSTPTTCQRGVTHPDALAGLLPHDARTMLYVGGADGDPADKVPHPATVAPGFVLLAQKRAVLGFRDEEFDLVFCQGVLERLAGDALIHARDELVRVSSRYLLASVPYREDIRRGRSTCDVCGMPNPPGGHVSTFDEETLAALFPEMAVVGLAFHGETQASTSAVSVALLDLARNPNGYYGRGTECMVCGAEMLSPPTTGALRRSLGALGDALNRLSERFTRPRPATLTVLLDKR